VVLSFCEGAAATFDLGTMRITRTLLFLFLLVLLESFAEVGATLGATLSRVDFFTSEFSCGTSTPGDVLLGEVSHVIIETLDFLSLLLKYHKKNNGIAIIANTRRNARASASNMQMIRTIMNTIILQKMAISTARSTFATFIYCRKSKFIRNNTISSSMKPTWGRCLLH